MEAQSTVEICGRHWTKCGYCKPDQKTSSSYGLMARRLTCQDYQDLIDRGWRRSGTFIYKPAMKETCCPQYTIRLDASQFKPNKNQRHVLNRLRRYLDSDDGSEEGGASDGNAQHGKQQPTKQRRQKPSPMSVDENMTVYHRRQPDQDQGREDDGNGKKRNKTEGKQTGLTNGGHGSSNGISGSSSSSNSSGENGHVKSRKEKRKGGGKIEGQEAADAKQLAAWSDIVATATALAVSDKVKSGGVFAGLTLEQGWETDLLPKWSQVRPIRSKSCQVSGGGFFSTVALSLASHARKRGWNGNAGETVQIAEAITARIIASGRGGGEGAQAGQAALSEAEIVVARNGFINFAARVLKALPAITISARKNEDGNSPNPPLPPPSGDTPRITTNSGPGASAGPVNDKPAGNGGAGSGNVLRGTGSGDHSQSGMFASSETGLSVGANDIDCSDVLGTAESGVDGDSGARGWSSKSLAEGAKVAVEMAVAGSRLEDRNKGSVNMAHAEALLSTAAAARVEAGAGGDEGSSNGNSSSLSTLPRLDPALTKHRMTISTVPARQTDEVFQLYRKYQVTVHGDDPDEITSEQFRRFLVDSPLIRRGGSRPSNPSARYNVVGSSLRRGRGSRNSTEGAPEGTEGRDSLGVPYGSYHQLYRIDGRLVAVGVVDILPTCLSSVYCFYDPDYRALSLGKVTALKETEFVREASELRARLKDYYMGFYIHTCPKMSYKGSFSPSFLLCPERFCWVPLDLCRPVLDRHKYARLSDLLRRPSALPSASPPLQSASGDHTLAADTARRAEAGGGLPVSQQSGSDGDRNEAARSSRSSSAARDAGGSGGTTPGRQHSSFSSASSSEHPTPPLPPSRTDCESPEMDVFPMDMPEDEARANAEMEAAAAQDAADEASGLYDIPLLLRDMKVPFRALPPHSQDMLKAPLRTYADCLGPELTRRIVLKLH